ncbi:ABC transporter substrate-binding protein [Calidithermus roseus]|uniref:Thiamine pyrimidine synthase n=1 Tax=Calidithermus roseus TaxID=1644118 RepID=A0A399EVY6_9DEIN|nr:ABC transporter substrate-binding protein [Calidithermus roseus]RIH87770.1 Riboflavin-binding protein RibY [Calidithermus roseus]
MRKWTVVLAVLVMGLASLGMAQQNLVKVNLQLKWFPQAQFAGFFVAKERGFFRAQGLDVTLLPAGDQSPIQVVQSGAADFGTTWIADLLVARERGIPVVHLAQIFQRSGFTLVALKSTGVKDLCKDLKGKSVGVWPSGNEYPAVALFRKCGLTSSLDPRAANPDVKAVSYPFDPSLVFPDKVQLVSAMTYNEVNQIAGLGYDESKVDVFKLADEGINLLEDLIFTTERVLNDRNFKGSGLTGRQVAARLIKASLQGWDWAVKNQAETVEKYVLPFCGNTCKGSGTRADAKGHQTWQMAEIAKLYNAGATTKGWAGFLVPADFQASVKLLRDQGILTKDPPRQVVDYGPWEEATGKKATDYK